MNLLTPSRSRKPMFSMTKKRWIDWLWDAWCLFSIVGIWPRFIEPKLLKITRLPLQLANLPSTLEGIKILHFSDLHWRASFPLSFQKKITKKINALNPDLILFTGDFISCAQLENAEGLRAFLNSLKANIGCFAVLGNHDYEHFVTVNTQGDYDTHDSVLPSTLTKAFKRLFRNRVLTGKITLKAKQTKFHKELMQLLAQTPFQILHNGCKLVAYKEQWINICGLGEYTLGKFNPEVAFKDYHPQYPGIVLSHNPDTLNALKHYPGDLILSGHTHGGQINIPWLWKRFTLVECPNYKRGFKFLEKKMAYINRGISGVMPFRWFAPPELTLITVNRAP